MSALRWRPWSASRSACAARGRSFSLICAPGRASTRSRALSRRRAGWGFDYPPPRSGGGGIGGLRPPLQKERRRGGVGFAKHGGGGSLAPCEPLLAPTGSLQLATSPVNGGGKSLTPSCVLPCRFQVAVALHRRAHQEAIAFADDALDVALLDMRVADHDIVLLA